MAFRHSRRRPLRTVAQPAVMPCQWASKGASRCALWLSLLSCHASGPWKGPNHTTPSLPGWHALRLHCIAALAGGMQSFAPLMAVW